MYTAPSRDIEAPRAHEIANAAALIAPTAYAIATTAAANPNNPQTILARASFILISHFT